MRKSGELEGKAAAVRALGSRRARRERALGEVVESFSVVIASYHLL